MRASSGSHGEPSSGAMINQVWKSFAANKISHSMAHYLTTLHALREKRGYARVSDIAEELDVKKGSVSVQIKQLKEKGFVVEDEKKHLQLTELGESAALQVLENRRVFIEFLRTVLGVPEDIAETDACKIEHLLSEETTRHLVRLVGLLQSDDPDAREFLRRYRGFEVECPSLENCDVCDDVCLVQVEPIRIDDPDGGDGSP